MEIRDPERAQNSAAFDRMRISEHIIYIYIYIERERERWVQVTPCVTS